MLGIPGVGMHRCLISSSFLTRESGPRNSTGLHLRQLVSKTVLMLQALMGDVSAVGWTPWLWSGLHRDSRYFDHAACRSKKEARERAWSASLAFTPSPNTPKRKTTGLAANGEAGFAEPAMALFTLLGFG